MLMIIVLSIIFFFNDTATTEIYTLSLHDALPISKPSMPRQSELTMTPGGTSGGKCVYHNYPYLSRPPRLQAVLRDPDHSKDRKSTRLNSSHANISYAVFCLKKKKKNRDKQRTRITYAYDNCPLHNFFF